MEKEVGRKGREERVQWQWLGGNEGARKKKRRGKKMVAIVGPKGKGEMEKEVGRRRGEKRKWG